MFISNCRRIRISGMTFLNFQLIIDYTRLKGGFLAAYGGGRTVCVGCLDFTTRTDISPPTGCRPDRRPPPPRVTRVTHSPLPSIRIRVAARTRATDRVAARQRPLSNTVFGLSSGNEDLGGGLHAQFRVESGFNLKNVTQSYRNTMFGRRAHAGDRHPASVPIATGPPQAGRPVQSRMDARRPNGDHSGHPGQRVRETGTLGAGRAPDRHPAAARCRL